MFATTLMKIQFGGKDLTKILLQMHLIGPVSLGIAQNSIRLTSQPTALILTQDLQHLLKIVLAFLLNLKRERVCRFQQLFSVVVVLSLLRLYINQRIGKTVYLSVLLWHLKQLLPLQVQLA